ncbi:MAG: IS4 family transposase [Candidatus Accumulibacter sp.]|jgi:hypothetical protein|nr:IS4 family transposase [Accumulibacter sp.]
MGRVKAKLSAGARLADYLAVGFLAWNCPLDKVRAVLVANEVQSKRRRGLPHEVLVYFVMAMVLYAEVAYEEVLRLVIEGLRPIFGEAGLSSVTVSKGAISQARGRVGAAPLRRLYEEQVRPHGAADMPGVLFAGLRVMALDGSTLEMPDEKANAEHFGYPGVSRGEAAFPRLRFVTMAECGTHTLCFANPGVYATGEITLAGPVIDQADATMLVTADRGFFNYPFWPRAAARGAKLLFRAKANQRLPRETECADGSYLTTLYANDKDRRRRVKGTVVRVIEYALDGLPDAEPSYRLVTNWLDIKLAPATELAALYHRRWTIEQAFDELKTHLATRAVTLRSKRPELVEQEFYALLLAHAAIRKLMSQAAQATQQAAEDLSFVHAVRIIKRRLPASAALPP